MTTSEMQVREALCKAIVVESVPNVAGRYFVSLQNLKGDPFPEGGHYGDMLLVGNGAYWSAANTQQHRYEIIELLTEVCIAALATPSVASPQVTPEMMSKRPSNRRGSR
jgi:hypothetical protein